MSSTSNMGEYTWSRNGEEFPDGADDSEKRHVSSVLSPSERARLDYFT